MTLDAKLEEIFRVTPRQRLALKKLGLLTVENLLEHFPYKYEDPANFKKISDLLSGERVRIAGRVTKVDFEKTWKRKINIAKATIEDGSGKLEAVWFRQPYIAKMLPEGSTAVFSGKIGIRSGKYYLANPLYEFISQGAFSDFFNTITPRSSPLYPLYSTSAGISSLWIQKHLEKILAETKVPEFLPDEIIKKYNLPERQTALRLIHFPKNLEHAEAAKKRLAFEKVFLLQLSRMKRKLELKNSSGLKIKNNDELKKEFLSLLPFKPTISQIKAMEDVERDLTSGNPMNRLLEGDVGSGKTAIAAYAAFLAAKNGAQATYMAPTEILARQHFENFFNLLGKSNIRVGLLTSSISEKFPSKINPKMPTHVSKSQLLKWAKEMEIHILIGTHSLIEKKVEFKNLALAMVDEQHRFGVNQRGRLLRKNSFIPHFLSMSATPIPRTLALSIYADLDISLISELPPGRKQIETKIVPPKERHIAYSFIRQRLNDDEQVFVICPRIQKSDKETMLKMEMKSVKEEYEKLKKSVFPEFEIGIMHGKLGPKEKEETMRSFRDGKIKILVSTSVIEVGVDVPNATVMMIEGAERFGLAQMHQFRGRVGRSEKQSYCFIFPNSYSENSRQRLKALKEAKSGFELAEYDLEFRGAGELTGKNQWGVSDIGMDALKNLKMVEAARTEAKMVVEKNLLAKFPLLQEKIQKIESSEIHFE
ncbi:MAG TPA: ATP-dependent DNA helicase RecG [Candidatus Paceibacterota bacterium]